ncbi:MAG: excinuclease ABC subunit UvrA [Aestuariivita sp.]|nr:excinuclease ABC subunit UvrA [Aestuariivita sp.]MCY4202174.1 excinuclease ABC subunit UvrA [Aestuariivita sp.]
MNQVKFIKVRGAREHNLKDVDVDIPRDQLIVITGLSGSGKSSIAFDTIYAEGQRRYVESLSAYARQFLNQMEKPDVDHIDGLGPAISIEQKTTSRNPRSTVGTVTEVFDYLRLLFARVGTAYSPATGLPIEAQQVQNMVDRVMAFPEDTRGILLAPIVRDRKGEYRKEFAQLRKDGYQRVKVDGKLCELDNPPNLEPKQRHNISVVIDRIVIREGIETRLADSFRTALNLTDGIAIFETVPREGEGEEVIFSENLACPVSGFVIPEVEPRLFSFNAPAGACSNCAGLGTISIIDENRIVPDPSLSLEQGAVRIWPNFSGVPNFTVGDNIIRALYHLYDFNPTDAWEELPKEVQQVILYGREGRPIKCSIELETEHGDSIFYDDFIIDFEGVIPYLREEKRSSYHWSRLGLSRYETTVACPECDGYRLRPEALAVKIADCHLGEVSQMSVLEALEWINGVPATLSKQKNAIARTILKEIHERLGFLNAVGLQYLSLSRPSGTLSGGESQRIRLASQIGCGLTGVLYVLDEPSIGLHQRDNGRLLETLKSLRDQGNTVIVVEHDEEAIRSADMVFDIGPGAGIHGGQIVSVGTPDQICSDPKSLTGQYLSGSRKIDVPSHRRGGKGQNLTIVNATANNLKNVTANIPLGKFTCVTGVSGGGKSTLVFETLCNAISGEGRQRSPDNCDEIKGLHLIDNVIHIDQRPIGRTPRSNPATYVGAFEPIRSWFADLPESKARGYRGGRFSFNVKGGRCEACEGDGLIRIEMHFLSDVYVTCDVCKGTRYNRETLEVKYRGKSISDVLNMTVEDAREFFKAMPKIRKKLDALYKVGLGYIKVGQSATTLSGGEAQRIKLSKELCKRSTGKTLYILDEPTTGLHFEDIRKLLLVLHEFVDQGNTVVVIEHNLDVIKTADNIIDLGPEGGDGGGEIVATGTPEQVANNDKSHTGQFLRQVLSLTPIAAE